MKSLFLFLSILLLATFLTVNTVAQIDVKLTLNQNVESNAGRILFCDKDFDCNMASTEQSKTDVFGKEKIRIKVWREGKDFYVAADKNLDNQLTDDEKILLKNGSKIVVNLKRKTESGEIVELPYQIKHELKDDDKASSDRFGISMLYASTGVLTYKTCSASLSLSDMNFDGSIGLRDVSGGTNLSLDLNNDGKFWGKAEHRYTSEIIEFCGQNFLVSALTSNLLTLTPTDLKIAKVGEQVPSFSFMLVNNKNVTTDSLKDKFYVLDFWASWCGPCIGKLPDIVALEKEYKDKLSVFTVNVDVASEKAAAEKVINEKQISHNTTIRGMGDDDALWKTFGGVDLNRLAIPLYVLVGKDGIVHYAGSGGENLVDLKNTIAKVLPGK